MISYDPSDCSLWLLSSAQPSRKLNEKLSRSSPPCNLSPSHCKTEPGTQGQGYTQPPLCQLAGVTSLRAASLLETGFWLLMNIQLFHLLLETWKPLITPEFTELSEPSWVPPFSHQRKNIADSSREEQGKPPWLLVKTSHGKRAGNSWVVRLIIHCPIKNVFLSWENTPHGTALCNSHPANRLDCFEGVKGNNIPPEGSMRSFL